MAFRRLRPDPRFENPAMQPETGALDLRDPQYAPLLARIVAWHNRHPLALRISAAQVHGLGVVSLPFVDANGAAATPVAASGEVPVVPAPMPEVPAPAQASVSAEIADDVVIELGDVAEPEPAADDPTDAAAVPPSEPEPEPEPDPLAALQTGASSDPTPDSTPGPAHDPAAESNPASASPHAAEPGAAPAPPPPPRAWRRAWQRLRGEGAANALFSENFIAPLSPPRVAAWAARHASLQRPLDADAPLRAVERDPHRGAAGVAVQPRYLLTAAVGVGDRNKRLLLATDDSGAVLGPRHWSRPRLALAAALLLAPALLAVSAPWATRSPAPALAMAAGPASAAAAASAQPAASEPSPAAAPTAEPAASAPVDAAPDGMPPPAAAPDGAQGHAPAEPDAHRQPPAPETAPASSPHNLHRGSPDATPTPDNRAVALNDDPHEGPVDRLPLVHPLDPAMRADLRREGLRLRAAAAASAPAAKAWALVTPPLTDRRLSQRVTAQLHAVALLQPLPMRAELMASAGGPRAVFWPFPSAADAEKVRLALADRGLRTEVVEF